MFGRRSGVRERGTRASSGVRTGEGFKKPDLITGERTLAGLRFGVSAIIVPQLLMPIVDFIEI